MKINKRIFILVAIILLILGLSTYIYFEFFSEDKNDFKVSIFLLKSMINEGESVTNTFRITNTGDDRDFQIQTTNLEDLIQLDSSNFNLNKGEIKEVKIVFEDKQMTYPPSIYTSTLIIKAGLKKIEIPIILEIQSSEILFATNLDAAPDYKEVLPGEQIPIDIKLFNLKDIKNHNIEIQYAVKNAYNEVITSESEKIVVGMDVSTTKTIDLPKDIELGNYVIGVIVKSGDSIATSSYLFKVSKDDDKKVSLTSDNYILTFIIITMAFLVGIVALVIYDRNSLFLRLEKQHKREVSSYITQIKEQQKKALAESKSKKEKRKIKRSFRKLRKIARKKIKQRHHLRKNKLRTLRKEKRHNKIKEQLDAWEKQGFDTGELFIKPTKEGKLEDQIKEWKKQGYDTSFLKK